MSKWEYVNTLQSTLIETSDNLSFSECYRICALKRHLFDLDRHVSQIVWGRRGTGKTTVLKAFSYYINDVKKSDDVSCYIMMSDAIPTKEEIAVVDEENLDITIYIFKKLLNAIADFFAEYYEHREHSYDRKLRSRFQDYHYLLSEAIALGKQHIIGVSVNENAQSTEELGKELGIDLKGDKSIKNFILAPFLNFSKTRSKKSVKNSMKEIKFFIETAHIRTIFIKILELLNINHLYVCLDEFCDIDKTPYVKQSIQSQVAQLVKQVFFKSELFSVKIASVWNDSKLHDRSINRFQGTEYKDDIFEGPDLDIMFLDGNIDAENFFKELIVNYYLLAKKYTVKDEAKDALADKIVDDIFGADIFRHLICGSQGIARGFVVLVREYLKRFSSKKEKLDFNEVFQLIIDQYLDTVRNRIPYILDIVKSINAHLEKNMKRYFLIEKSDYDRCEIVIKYLAGKNFIMQVPGHKTSRKIRDSYKLFVINYGNYLEVKKMETSTLSTDSKLIKDGAIFPSINPAVYLSPEDYTIKLPIDCERQYYCPNCSILCIVDEKHACPKCQKSIDSYATMDLLEKIEARKKQHSS